MLRNRKNKDNNIKQRRILAKRSCVGMIAMVISPIIGLAILVLSCFTEMWYLGIIVMTLIVIGVVLGAKAYNKTPKIIAEIDGEELIFYRVKNAPLRVKAQDIVSSTSIVDGQNIFYGSVMVELTNGERLYYHSILNAYRLARDIETWKHAQLVNKINEIKRSEAIVEEDKLDIQEGEDKKNSDF